MDTTTTSPSRFWECIGNNLFFESIYPTGLGEVFIGQFGLDQGRFSINLHIYAKPQKEVPKWEVWGKNYNVVVLEFLGDQLKTIEIENWDNFSRAELSCTKNGAGFSLCQRGSSWGFEVSFGMLAFQRSNVYIDENIDIS